MKTFLSLAILVLSVSACGVDNVTACNNWKNSMSKCGTSDFTSSISCNSYSNTTCDLSPYFNCLKDGFKCTNDTPDISGWSTCASKAVCQ